ncbi:MAG TPA: FUSC family protein [Desulfomicrobiaceae bacterium]|nr:FUSC family protein [Desulfomicrobiaceae bacterium]
MRMKDAVLRLRRELTTASPAFRHALRAGLATSAAFIAARMLGLSHEMWVIVSVVVIMRPSLGGTLRFGRDRVLGTIAGALVAIAVVLLTKASGVWFVLLLVVSFFTTLFLHVVHYLGFVTFLSFTVVLGLGIVFPEGWKLGVERIWDTLLGGGIGLGAAFFIWPNRAAKGIDSRVASSLNDLGALFRILGKSYQAGEVRPEEIVAARRKTYDSLNGCREIFSEAAAEAGLSRAGRNDLSRLSAVLDKLYDLLMSMDTVVRRVSGEGPPESLGNDLHQLLETVDLEFAWMTDYARGRKEETTRPNGAAALAEMFDRIRIVRARGDLEGHSMEHRTNLSAFLYHVYAVVQELENGFELLKSYRAGRTEEDSSFQA